MVYSFIRNLDQYFLTALAKSASSDQVPNLRDAMWSHLSFRASMRIKVAEVSYLIKTRSIANPNADGLSKVSSRAPFALLHLAAKMYHRLYLPRCERSSTTAMDRSVLFTGEHAETSTR